MGGEENEDEGERAGDVDGGDIVGEGDEEDEGEGKGGGEDSIGGIHSIATTSLLFTLP